MTIHEPGIIPNLPIEKYVADPAPAPSLSASIAHELLSRSPRHAWFKHPRLNTAYEHDATKATDRGTIAHGLLLEGDASRVTIIGAENYKTKKAQEQRDAARAEGRLPILVGEHEDVKAMVDVARAYIATTELADEWASGLVEHTLVWQERDLWFRSRPDWGARDWRILVDYKTAGRTAEPDAFGRQLLTYGYELQAALALRGIRALAKPRDPVFVFLVQEVEPPYACSLVSLSPEFLEFAARKLETAITAWGDCLRANRWPSYPSAIAYVEPPAWATYGFEMRQATAAPVEDERPLADQLFGQEASR